jgi:hypothetical protein
MTKNEKDSSPLSTKRFQHWGDFFMSVAAGRKAKAGMYTTLDENKILWLTGLRRKSGKVKIPPLSGNKVEKKKRERKKKLFA